MERASVVIVVPDNEWVDFTVDAARAVKASSLLDRRNDGLQKNGS